ncbi:hypothetical protein KI387_001449, partial [Taxus chinensis]
MTSIKCFSSVYHACFPSKAQASVSGLVCSARYSYSPSVGYAAKSSTRRRRRTVVSVATDQSTKPDKAEESAGALSANREPFSVGRSENGAARSYSGKQARESLPMGLSEERMLKYECVSVKDYLDRSRELIAADGGPPRWFCPLECSDPPKDAPVLFFLPGMDGTGLGLILHHQTLADLFEVRCLHIPVMDRTSFEDLVKTVEEAIRLEHKVSPMRPIYLVGDSLGGCLALAIAARNPTIDLVLILANPATSFYKSQLQPLFPLLEAMPAELHGSVPYLLSFVMGDPVRMAMAGVKDGLPLLETVQQLSYNLEALLPRLS